MINLCPCGFLIVEFIFDALVFEMGDFYISTLMAFGFMIINYIYTEATDDAYSKYFQWRTGDISIFYSILFIAL